MLLMVSVVTGRRPAGGTVLAFSFLIPFKTSLSLGVSCFENSSCKPILRGVGYELQRGRLLWTGGKGPVVDYCIYLNRNHT